MKQSKLSTREIEMSFRGEHMNNVYPPTMTLSQVTELLQIGRSTFYGIMAEGGLESAKITIGTKAMFNRDLILMWLFGR